MLKANGGVGHNETLEPVNNVLNDWNLLFIYHAWDRGNASI